MSASANKHVVRMGPITVLSLVIVISLATMAVLSFATAQAASRTTARQEAAMQSLYANEKQGQEFVMKVDAALEPYRGQGASTGEALQGLAGSLSDASIEGNTIVASFANGTRTLKVKLGIQQDLSYTIEEWSTTTELGEEEKPILWQGE